MPVPIVSRVLMLSFPPPFLLPSAELMSLNDLHMAHGLLHMANPLEYPETSIETRRGAAEGRPSVFECQVSILRKHMCCEGSCFDSDNHKAARLTAYFGAKLWRMTCSS